MSLVYIDGFDWFVDQVLTENFEGRWAESGTGAADRYERVTDTASGTGAAVRLEGNAGIAHTLESGSIQTCIIGFRFRVADLSSDRIIMEIRGAGASLGVHGQLTVNSSGQLVYKRSIFTLGTGVATIAVDTWTYIEFKILIDDSVGTVQTYINGSSTADMDASGLDTNNGGDDVMDSFELMGSSGLHDFDDLYVDDTDLLGDVYVETLSPDGAGTDADFTPLAGTNWEAVDELPTDNDTTYVESSTVNDRDRHTHGDLPADTDTVLGVQVGIWAKKDVAGDRLLRVLADDGVTEGEGAVLAPAASAYTWLYSMFEDHPTDANPWTESEVNAGEFGFTVES